MPDAYCHDWELYDIAKTVEVLQLLRSVDVPVKNPAALAHWIQDAQTPDGRFATEDRYNRLFVERHPAAEMPENIHYHHPLITGARPYSEIEETAQAVRALQLLDADPRDKAACVAWLQALQQPEGYFARPRHANLWAVRQDGLDPDRLDADALAEYCPHNDLDDTYWAILALDALGARPRDIEACRSWLQRAVQAPTRLVAAHRALLGERWIIAWDRLDALYLLRGHLQDEASWIAYARQGRNGGILKIGAGELKVAVDQLQMKDLVDTARSFRILGLLGNLDETYLASFR
jgi:hypothetical protein